MDTAGRIATRRTGLTLCNSLGDSTHLYKGHIAQPRTASLQTCFTKPSPSKLSEKAIDEGPEKKDGAHLQAFDSPLTRRLQRLGASLLMGVVSRRLSPLRGLREGERDLGMLVF